MIVRCNNCASAYAVDDEKVANKKFAFTCPKCSSENIIDNRVTEKTIQLEESPFNDDFSVENDFPETEREQSGIPDEKFIDDMPPEKDNEIPSVEDDFSMDFPDESMPEDTEKKGRKINLEIEESADFDAIEDDLFAEEPQQTKKEMEDDLLSEIPAFDTDEEISLPGDKESDITFSDEFDIELKDDIVKPEDEDILFDDFDDTPEKPAAKKNSPEIETDFDLDDIDTDSLPEETKSDRDQKLTSQDDIDTLFSEEGINFDEKPISSKSELEFEDEITVDLDLLDIELEGPESDKPDKEITADSKIQSSEDDIAFDIDTSEIDLAETEISSDIFDEPAEPVRQKQKTAPSEDDITLDIDNLDIDLEETEISSDLFDEPAEPVRQKQKAAPSEDDITLDIDNLDIDLEETEVSSDLFDEPAEPVRQKQKTAPSENDITLDIDNLDIDLEETEVSSDLFDEPAEPVRQKQKAAPSEDDITLDIDNLDIDLEETEVSSDLFDEPAEPVRQKQKTAPSEDDITLDIDNLDIDLDETAMSTDLLEEPAAVKSKAVSPVEDEFDEEDIKLNLDDLDIDLDEIEERELIFEDDISEKKSPAKSKKVRHLIEDEEEDESITIDLDSLEIEIAEENSKMNSELSEEDEKLTLDDAGLTFDELTAEMEKTEFSEADEEDLKLTLEEIDPDLTLDRITKSAEVETEFVSDTLEELPEIDLDEYDAIVRQEETISVSKKPEIFKNEIDDDSVIFPETGTGRKEENIPDYDIFDYEESEHEKISPAKGGTYFSIDFSLKYSRIGALLRLLGLYMLSMIPHFVVMLIYTILSSIIGFINQIVILSTGRCVEDFAIIIENTMRYFFYIKTNITGIVEDRPVYAGREYLDHPLQLNITYPLKYSKNLAILRLSVVGILLVTLPHLVIMLMITVTIPIAYLAGIIAVIATRRWPNSLFNYITRYFRYLARISSFMTGLTDEYPPFNFD